MKVIRLYGELGKKFGRVFRLHVRSTSEAIRALSANLPGFEECLVTAESRGVGYKIKVGNDYLGSVDHLGFPVSGHIKIIPTVLGANAEARVLIGAVIVAASFALDALTGGATAPFTAYSKGIGISLILGGVAQMLSPPPKSPGPREDPNNQPSYTFAGPVNTSAQGQCVPICFGQMLVGSAIVSAGITVAQIKSGYLERTRIVTKDMTVPYMTSHPDEVPRNPISKTLLSRVVISIEFGTPIYLETYRFTYKETYLVEA